MYYFNFQLPSELLDKEVKKKQIFETIQMCWPSDTIFRYWFEVVFVLSACVCCTVCMLCYLSPTRLRLCDRSVRRSVRWTNAETDVDQTWQAWARGHPLELINFWWWSGTAYGFRITFSFLPKPSCGVCLSVCHVLSKRINREANFTAIELRYGIHISLGGRRKWDKAAWRQIVETAVCAYDRQKKKDNTT